MAPELRRPVPGVQEIKTLKPHELLDPDFRSFLTPSKDTWSLKTLSSIRERVNSTYKSAQASRCKQRATIAVSGNETIQLCLYRPKMAPTDVKLSAIMYIHGGGFVLGRPEMADDYLADLADELQTLIVAVDYRLAPEHSFPIPLEDCYAALSWMVGNQDCLCIDAQRIVIMGHSAGGGLAAALCILTRDKSEYTIAGQILVYPMLDHRTGAAFSPYRNEITGTIGWSSVPNQFCWDCMRGDYRLDDDRAGLFSPSVHQDLTGLPPSFISVGALDLFLEEDVTYALNLSRAGVAVELHVYPGAPHMFDQYPGRITTQSKLDIANALKKYLKSA